MDMAAIFSTAACTPNLKARNKEAALDALAAQAVKSGKTGSADAKTIAAALTEREKQGSTGFGDEIAIPHARIAGLQDFIIFAAHEPKGVDYQSLDRKKAKLFFVILGPEDRHSEHVQLLAAISRALSGSTLKKEMMTAKTADIMAEAFLRHSAEKTDTAAQGKKKLKLLILILYMEDFLHHILEYFLKEGVEGATILDSSGMGRYISNIPLFATFIGFMNEQKNHSHTILATIPADDEDEIIKGIERITGDLDRKQGAMLMTLDIGHWKGTMKQM